MAMLESYKHFIAGVRNPGELMSLSDDQLHSKHNRFFDLAKRCRLMTYTEVLHESRIIVDEVLREYPYRAKRMRNVSQYWLDKIKGGLINPTIVKLFEENA
jgi:hypothetical protein